MDVVSGEFKFDFHTGQVTSKANGAGRQYLDPEIGGEGVKVIMSNGETITYNPPPAKPSMPDWSEVKQIKKYFNRTDYHFFPIWLYHPAEPAAIAKSAEEAWEKFGVRLVERTADEQARYGGGKYRWEWRDDTLWRPAPHAKEKFDADNPGHGKNLITKAPDPKTAQNALLAELIPTVTAAVVAAMKANGGASAPAHVDAAEWEEFQRFQAFKRQQAGEVPAGGALTAGNPATDDERAVWETQAKELGLKIDGRWSLDRLRKEVGTELDKRAAAQSGDTA